MDFVYKIDTPANTPASSPKLTTARLTRGRMVGASIYFPSGPAGTLHLIAKIGVHQILPFNVGASLALDDCVFPAHINIDLAEPPFFIDFLTWNSSALYTHTLTVSIFLEPMDKRKWKLTDVLNPFESVKGYRKP